MSSAKYPVQAPDGTISILTGIVTLGTTSIDSQICTGFSVARTGVGAYTLTLDDAWSEVVGISTHVIQPSGVGEGVSLFSDTVDMNAGTITFNCWGHHLQTNVDLSADMKLSIVLYMLSSGGPASRVR